MVRVGIVIGSKTDLPKMKKAQDALNEFGISSEIMIASAHRTPERVRDWVLDAEERGLEVLIAGAGMSAHLAGVVASMTVLPVIGVPCSGGALGGVDALYSTVNMPKGTPVATVAIDGAYNAGLLAVHILSVREPELKEKLRAFRKKTAESVSQQSDQIQQSTEE